MVRLKKGYGGEPRSKLPKTSQYCLGKTKPKEAFKINSKHFQKVATEFF